MHARHDLVRDAQQQTQHVSTHEDDARAHKQQQQQKRHAASSCFRRWLSCRAGWDLSWWTAFLFLAGSLCWVANGAFAYHQPLQGWSVHGHVLTKRDNEWAANIAGFAGGTLFYFGGQTHTDWREPETEASEAPHAAQQRRNVRLVGCLSAALLRLYARTLPCS